MTVGYYRLPDVDRTLSNSVLKRQNTSEVHAKTLVCAHTNSLQNRHDFEQSHNAAAIKCSQISMRLFNYS
jgi:hypothetical protein